jgi:Fur family ferric uptake transcriptional regulator
VKSMTNFRNTKQRRAILSIFRKASRPLSASEVYRKAREIYPQIALTTVYRNLEQLTEQRVLRRHRLRGKEYSYTLNERKKRHYIVCLSCDRMVSIDKCPIEEHTAELAEITGYQIVMHDVQLYGYCQGCRCSKDESEEKSGQKTLISC